MSRIVAHRGQQATFPENTLEGIQEAIRCGARAVEFDVQMSADHTPVVCHDVNLLRTAGIDFDITQNQYADIKTISVGEPLRFNEQHTSINLPSLQDVVTYLTGAPDVLAFVELKDESIDIFGINAFIEPIIEQLLPLKDHCIVIADNLQALIQLKQATGLPIGWIIHRWADDDFARAKQQQVDYLVINYKYCPDLQYDFSADPWQWVMYETRNPDKAVRLFEQGVSFVETDDVCQLLKRLPGYK